MITSTFNDMNYLIIQKSQTGATLFMGLMLLLAISLISLAAMRTSILDLMIANNQQQYAYTFQAAEQVVNDNLTTMSLNIEGTELAGDTVENFSAVEVNSKTSSNQTVKVADVGSEVIYRSKGSAAGWQLGGSVYHFQMDVNAKAPGRGAASNQRIGFYIVGAN